MASVFSYQYTQSPHRQRVLLQEIYICLFRSEEQDRPSPVHSLCTTTGAQVSGIDSRPQYSCGEVVGSSCMERHININVGICTAYVK